MASGGEQGIRTLEQVIACYTISSRAPSASSDNSPYLPYSFTIITNNYLKIKCILKFILNGNLFASLFDKFGFVGVIEFF